MSGVECVFAAREWSHCGGLPSEPWFGRPACCSCRKKAKDQRIAGTLKTEVCSTGCLCLQEFPSSAATAVSDVERCRWSDSAFPEPAEYVPQQIHVTPAGALLNAPHSPNQTLWHTTQQCGWCKDA